MDGDEMVEMAEVARAVVLLAVVLAGGVPADADTRDELRRRARAETTSRRPRSIT